MKDGKAGNPVISSERLSRNSVANPAIKLNSDILYGALLHKLKRRMIQYNTNARSLKIFQAKIS
jgi:hypothetical protein